MAPRHVYQVKDTYLISFLLEQPAGVPNYLTFWIQNHHAAVCLHDIRFHVKAGLACSASAYDQNIQISSVLMSIKAYPHVLCQYLVHIVRALSVLAVHGCGIAPLCRAVFLSAPVVAACG